MPRLTAQNPETATGKTKDLFNAVQAKFGMVPNVMRTFAVSPTALEAYLQLSGTLGHTLDAAERELIALAVAEANGCDYCAAAHSTIGKMVGLNAEQILGARKGSAATPRHAAIVALALAITKTRGKISDAQFDAAKAAGISESDVAEIVANVALNVLTNYFNNVAQTKVDFPAAAPLGA